MEPDDATLAMATLLGPGASIVSDAVKVLMRDPAHCQPVVNTARRCDHTLIADRVMRQLSERQRVVSDRVPPMRDGLL